MKKTFLLLATCAFYLIATSQPAKVGFVSTFESLTELQNTGDDDEYAAANWLVNTYGGIFIPVSQIKSGSVNLSDYKALWIHFDRPTLNSTNIETEFNSFTDTDVKNKVEVFYKAGGNLLLTMYANRYLVNLNRITFYPEIQGFGNGGSNPDTWYICPQYGTWDISKTVFDRSTDPIYEGLTAHTVVRGNGQTYSYFPLIGSGHKEDHNYFWTMDATGLNNDNPQKITKFETDYSALSLGTWGHVQDYFGSAITRWYPVGDFQGKAITIGVAAYEWNQNSGTNTFQANVERMTKNALDELSPNGISTAKTDLTNEKTRLIIHNNSLEFENLNESATARIFAVNGKLISIHQLHGNSSKIDTSNLLKGIYIVGVENNNNINLFKFIK